MAAIQLKGLTPNIAEKVIARVWHVLEQHDIDSPRIDTRPAGGDCIAVQFTFQTQRDADTVARALEGLWSVVAQAPRGGRQLS